MIMEKNMARGGGGDKILRILQIVLHKITYLYKSLTDYEF